MYVSARIALKCTIYQIGEFMENSHEQNQNTIESLKKATDFVSETIEKHNEKKIDKYDFGWKAPSQNIGNQEASVNKSNNTAGSQAYRYTSIVNNRDDAGKISSGGHSTHDKVHNSDKANPNDRIYASNTARISSMNGNSDNEKFSVGSKILPHVQHNEKNSFNESRFSVGGSERLNLYDAKTGKIKAVPSDARTLEKANISTQKDAAAKKYAVAHLKSSNKIQNIDNQETSLGNTNQQGIYNTGRHDMTAIANAAVESVREQYNTSESVEGYNFIYGRNNDSYGVSYGSKFGIGTISRSTSKTAVSHSIYNNSADADRLTRMFGNDYRINTTRTGNIIADHKHNVDAVEKYLMQHNINAQNLNRTEIILALNSGELKKWYHHGSNIKVDSDSDLKFALKELLKLRKDEDVIKQFQNTKGGIKDTAKAWVHDSFGDSDIAQGARIASASKSVVKVSEKAVVVAGKGLINTGLNGVTLTKKAPLIKEGIYTKVKIRTAKSIEEKGKFKEHLNSVKEAKYKINSKNMESKHKVSSFNPVGNAKAKAKAKVTEKIENTRFMKRFRSIQNRLGKTKVGKVVGGTLDKFKKFVSAFKWAIIGIAIAIIVYMLLVVVILGVSGKAGSGTSKAAEKDAGTTNAQQSINYLYGYHNAYSNNIYQANMSNMNADGSLMIEKRLPNSWFSQMKQSDEYINQGHASVWYNGSMAGYDLSKYWGEASDKNNSSLGYDVSYDYDTNSYGSYGTRACYTDAIQVPTDEIIGYDDDGNPIYKTKTIFVEFNGHAGFNGEAGMVYEGLKGLPDGATIKFNYNGSGHDNYIVESTNGGELLADWKERVNENVTEVPIKTIVHYWYRGSSYSCHITENKVKVYTNSEGKEYTYNVDEFYKGILTMAAGATDNYESAENDGSEIGHTENVEFYKKYCKKLFDQIMEDAKVVLTYKYEDNPAERVDWEVCDTDTGAVYACSHSGFSCKPTLEIFIQHTGIADMMLEDSKTTFGEAGDKWMHSNGSTGVYKVTNKSDPEYVQWLTTYKTETDMPVWGKNQHEKEDQIKEVFPKSKCNKTHDYTTEMANTIEMYNLTVEDWKTSVTGLLFPAEVGIADFTSDKTIKAMKSMDSMKDLYDKNIDWSKVNWDEFTTGDASLDEFMKFATTQGWIQKETGQVGLCYFTTMMMIAMYMHPNEADYIKENLAEYAKAWCASDGEFFGARENGSGNSWESKFGAKIGYDTTFSTPNDMRVAISEQLENGNPVVLHVRGQWDGPTGEYHRGSDQHFMVIYGADAEGIKVADPAGTATGKVIPWESLYEQIGEGKQGTGIRTITPMS